MQSKNDQFAKWGFTRTFVLPALLIFAIPVLGLLFFWHAQQTFDRQARESLLKEIEDSSELDQEQRAALTSLYTKVPFSTLMLQPTFAAGMDEDVRINYATFYWMIRLSLLSIAGGIAVFVLVGFCVLLSLRSPWMQWVSLTAGWHLLRIYGAIQTVIIGTLVFVMSYWGPVLWFHFYSVNVIGVVGILALIAIFVVIKALFTNPKGNGEIGGALLDRGASAVLWQQLQNLCDRMGLAPPDQVIAGIDDNFFVTEHPVTVDGKEYRGKTLFVSLPLLKQLPIAEANCVMAHEMAHFSGHDTLYSHRISPLLMRYDNYLVALHGALITIPVYCYVLCFRMLFELSLNKIRREREFRADRIAAEFTSPHDLARALFRITAYSKFRSSIETDLFKQEQVMEWANISERIQHGFSDYAAAFASNPERELATQPHPFDTHPPMIDRMQAVGVNPTTEACQAWLALPRDGGWHSYISDADTLERQQWQAYETRFRHNHEVSLSYRFLPETQEEQAIVERAFPLVQIQGKDGTLSIDFEKISHSTWSIAIAYKEITTITNSGDTLDIHYRKIGDSMRQLYFKRYSLADRKRLLETFERYYGRYLTAAAFRAQMQQDAENQASPTPAP